MAKDSNGSKSIIFRNILVAVDTSSHSRAALQAAAVLAQKMEGSIHGIFVQDEIWQKISKLPAKTTISELTGARVNLEEQDIQQQINMLKKRLQRELQTISRQNKISYTWQTVQGRVEKEILKAARDADLVTIGRRGCSFPQKKKLGSSAKAIIQTTDKPLLILKKGLQLGESVSAIYDGSDESRRSVQLAISLAEKNESSVTVLRINDTRDIEQPDDEGLEKMIASSPVSIEVQQLNFTNIWSLTHSINRRRAGLLIIPKNQPLLKGHLETVLYQLDCPLLLMN